MIDMDARLKKEKMQAKLLLQVHDELIFEAPKEEIALLEKLYLKSWKTLLSLLYRLK